MTCHDLTVIGLLLVLCVIVVRWQLWLVKSIRKDIEKDQ